MESSYSRIKKLSHADTVLYEIYMLRFAVNRLREGLWRDARDAWAYLENFLLHYRNLIDFLGKEASKLRDDDVHVTNIWELTQLPVPSDLNEIYEQGRKLREKYEPSQKDGQRISQYLQHCTEKRIEPIDWFVNQMANEIEPMLVKVEKYLEPRRNPDLTRVAAIGLFKLELVGRTDVYTPVPSVIITKELK